MGVYIYCYRVFIRSVIGCVFVYTRNERDMGSESGGEYLDLDRRYIENQE